MSDISVEVRTSSDPGGTATPNCVDCSRSVAHRVCSVLHLHADGWVIEHGARHEKLDLHDARTDHGKP